MHLSQATSEGGNNSEWTNINQHHSADVNVMHAIWLESREELLVR
jgi:hypothetical protein